MITIRPLEGHDLDFFLDMHYESIHILQGKPEKHELLNEPAIRKYHAGWGKPGDRAFVALKENHLAGAVWYRLFPETDKGYGFIDSDTPELGIAVHPAYRGIGLGRSLMHEIIKQAERDGYPSLSLSVDPQNTSAVKLYQSLEFVYWGVSGTSWTIKLTLPSR